MCDCEEIQKEWIPKYYNMVANKGGTVGHYKRSSKNQSTWLPRQDQLQEMVKKDGDVVDWQFYHFANDGLTDYLNYFNSMEQLWLAFVMKEKHNKTWSNGEWNEE